MNDSINKIDPLDKPLPIWVMIVLPIYGSLFLALLIFPIAKDWGWLEGWLFVITFAINIGISYFIINQRNPRVIRNRMKLKKEGLSSSSRKSADSDRYILPIVGIGYFGAILIADLNHRYGWTVFPLPLELVGLLISNIGLVIMDFAMLQNAFASKILDINKGQELIDTGLYSRVRHPLYAGGIIWIMAAPVALGSWWALLPAAVAAAGMIMRIKPEEQMLVKGMKGYTDYQSRVKYKLFPGVF
jgi:protein-S-isoprenylcysteine O-methyltransferase Ste14